MDTLGELFASGDIQRYLDAPDERAPHVLRQVFSGAPDKLRELISVAGSEELQQNPEMLTRISTDQLLDVQKLLQLPQPQWRKLIQATASSPVVLSDAIRTLRDSRSLSDFDWDALLDASSAPAQSGPAFDLRTSWLSRLSAPQQLALLVAILTLLNEFTKLLAIVTHENAPEDVEPAIAVVFAAGAILLMMLDAKTKAPE